jgi:hypothetical protein
MYKQSHEIIDFTKSELQDTMKIDSEFLEDMTYDFEDLKLVKPGQWNHGISKLRESYLEASKDVLNLLKVLETEKVNDPLEFDLSMSKERIEYIPDQNEHLNSDKILKEDLGSIPTQKSNYINYLHEDKVRSDYNICIEEQFVPQEKRTIKVSQSMIETLGKIVEVMKQVNEELDISNLFEIY